MASVKQDIETIKRYCNEFGFSWGGAALYGSIAVISIVGNFIVSKLATGAL